MARTLTESPFVPLALTHTSCPGKLQCTPTEGLGELYQENGPHALGTAGQPATGPPGCSPHTLPPALGAHGSQARLQREHPSAGVPEDPLQPQPCQPGQRQVLWVTVPKPEP